MKRVLCWGYFVVVAAYVFVTSCFDMFASVELDHMCMQSGMLGRMWKNKHCTNAARDLENGPFALFGLVFNRLVDWRVVCAVGGGVAFFSAIGALSSPSFKRERVLQRLAMLKQTMKMTMARARARTPLGLGLGLGGNRHVVAPEPLPMLMMLSDWEHELQNENENEEEEHEEHEHNQ